MTISVSAGSFMYIMMAVIIGVIILSMLLKKGDRNKKIITVVIVLAVFIFIYILFGRPAKIVIDEQGINSTAYGKIEFNWSDVKSAEYISNYQNSPYKPSLKLNGTALKYFRVGKFRLVNGDNVKLVTQKSDDALIFYTSDGIYLFAIDQLKEMIDIADNYIEVVY